MKNNILKNLNVFQGVGESVEPEKNSFFSRWNLLKGKAGNTSPTASLPFGNVTCSPYSGGYPTGYGNLQRNGGEKPKTFFEGDKIIGFSHFTHSGVGAIGCYYNYLLTVPHKGELSEIRNLREIEKEKATAGYYNCLIKDDNIKAEVTVCDKVAIHRYKSLDGKPFKISIDVSNDGLAQPWDEKVFSYSEESALLKEQDKVVGYVLMQGVKLYFCIKCDAKFWFWVNNEKVEENELKLKKTKKPFGVTFDIEKNIANLKIAFSLVSIKNAILSLENSVNFEKAKKNAEKSWKARLSTIKITGVSKEDKEIFYSNYYHSLVKPSRWKEESFLWDEKEDFYLDFATLWDVYKTQIPFIFTLYGDVGRGIVKTLIRYGKSRGKLFNALLLSSNMNIEATQACCLGCYVLYDAYVRGLVDGELVDDMFAVVKAEIAQFERGIKEGSFEKTTKLLDCTLIAESFAKLAKELNKKEYYEYFIEIAKFWTQAFDLDGLLKKDYPYYEGNHWNYSFRFFNDAKKRVELAGGKEKLTEQLDAFFAFNDKNSLENRFEGFNNETDMETPYFYHYVGCYDRLERVMKECVSSCFRTGRKGLPGNNDSGGLSACYLWNFLGLFPVSGQKVMFFGYPKAKKSVLRLFNGKKLIILSKLKGNSVKKITVNGKEVSDYQISLDVVLNGAKIVFS